LAAITLGWYRFVPFTGINLDHGQNFISKFKEQLASTGIGVQLELSL
jgi:hypothetical protein